jgi:adenylate kinase
LLNRGKTSGRSDDSDESVIRKRFAVYQEETSPVAGHYQQAGKFKSIAGEGTVDGISEALCAAIDAAR